MSNNVIVNVKDILNANTLNDGLFSTPEVYSVVTIGPVDGPGGLTAVSRSKDATSSVISFDFEKDQFFENGRFIPVTIQLFEDDQGANDDVIDIDPAAGDSTLNLVYDVFTGNVSGDVSGGRGELIVAEGDSNFSAGVRFSIDHVSPNTRFPVEPIGEKTPGGDDPLPDAIQGFVDLGANNSLEQAVDLGALIGDVALVGNHDDNLDFYKFEVHNSSNLRLSMLSSELEPTLNLLNRNGALIKASASLDGFDTVVSQLDAGVYFLEVDNSGLSGESPYRISVSADPLVNTDIKAQREDLVERFQDQFPDILDVDPIIAPEPVPAPEEPDPVPEAPDFGADDGKNRIEGTPDRDLIDGLGGSDRINGLDGEDLLLGGEGNDRLDGGLANDILSGNDGRDTYTGGSGADQFITAVGEGRDTIRDFEIGVDTIIIQDDSAVILNGVLLSFDNLVIDQRRKDAEVKVGDETLIRLKNTDADELSASDFRFVGGGFQPDLEFRLSGVESRASLSTRSAGDELLGNGRNEPIVGSNDQTVRFGKSGADTFVLDSFSAPVVIKNFEDSVDVLGFTSGLDIQSLDITTQGTNTAIALGNQLIATLEGVQSNVIGVDDFVQINGASI